MNKLLLFKVKKNIKNQDIIEKVVKEIQDKFKIDEKANAFDIENKINDKEYEEIIKQYLK